MNFGRPYLRKVKDCAALQEGSQKNSCIIRIACLGSALRKKCGYVLGLIEQQWVLQNDAPRRMVKEMTLELEPVC